ncbi:hypothetical protein [Mongoliitalea daihaiensis]|uniref:hypothetical protein n=1 Tax=Mongoliitalea daihaiensis TaxID=2782006 RepID=UPI001F24CCF4|nr:hypothetical protein [Mongoliitalea daihaiensis]UJP66675.1 hypothetical protein IPZ59_08845 [Mongoliitalea daihaiensis]
MASFIDDLFGKLFSKKRKPLQVKENFVQSPQELTALENWLKSSDATYIFDLVGKNYHFKKAGINNEPEVHFLNSPYANGFAVSYDPPFNPETFSKLFFAFGRRMLALGYRQVSLDRKIEEINEKVKTTEKQYFKPPLQAEDFNAKIDQLYGNVSVEKVTIDNEPSFIKVLVTVYSDHLYQPAKPFEEFIDHIFETNNL